MTDEYEDNEEKLNTERRKRAAAAYTEATVYDQEPHHEIEPEEGEEEIEDESFQTLPEILDEDEKVTVVEAPSEAPVKNKEKDKAIAGMEKEITSLQEELDQVLQKSAEYFDGWQRERADFANYKKRIDREQSQWTQTISTGIIKKYLVVMDDLERALKTRPVEGEGASWAEGIELIYRKLQNILEAEGIERIEAESMEFNPTYHEAISHEDNEDHESGEIIEVVQQGYKLGERIIRPALVRVAR